MSYRLATDPAVIPVPGGKLIEELFGRVSSGEERFSLAHMVAPPRWGEPAQTPDFGEITVMVRGRLRIQVGDDEVVLGAGQALWVEAGTRVHYENPFDEECEYFAICLPAFTPEAANREE